MRYSDIPVNKVFVNIRMPRTPMLRLVVNRGRSAIDWREYDKKTN